MNRNRRNPKRARFGIPPGRKLANAIAATGLSFDEFAALIQRMMAETTAAIARLSADVQRGTQDHHTEDQ